MGPFGIVIGEPFANLAQGLSAGFKCPDIDAFVFQRPPQPLDHAAVHCPAVDRKAINEKGPAPLPVHGYFHRGAFQNLREVIRGKL